MTKIVCQTLVVILTFIGVTFGQWTSADEKYIVSIGDLKTWEMAFENCTSINRTLVTIQNETEHFEILAAGKVLRAVRRHFQSDNLFRTYIHRIIFIQILYDLYNMNPYKAKLQS